jgi:hypothetical protein
MASEKNAFPEKLMIAKPVEDIDPTRQTHSEVDIQNRQAQIAGKDVFFVRFHFGEAPGADTIHSGYLLDESTHRMQ